MCALPTRRKASSSASSGRSGRSEDGGLPHFGALTRLGPADTGTRLRLLEYIIFGIHHIWNTSYWNTIYYEYIILGYIMQQGWKEPR